MVRKMTSAQVQAIMGPKVTDKMLFHELDRFTNMTKEQLLKRLKKIKNPIKAEAMRQFAKDAGERSIVIAARNRRNVLAC